MIVTSYLPVDLYALVPEALQCQDPVVAALDPLIDEELVQLVRADFGQRYPQSVTRGRPSTPVEVIVRMLVVRRLYDWSYADTAHWVADSISLRQFCRVGTHPVPDASTLDRWAACLQPDTLRRLNDRLVMHAQQHGVTRGRKLRLDTTVVETTIHYPSDSTLLADGVRVLSRLVSRTRSLVAGPASLFRSRVRSAVRRARAIGESTRRGGTAGQLLRQRQYRALVGIARAMVRQVRQIITCLPHGAPLRARLVTMADRTEQVIEQTTRRLAGEAVPAGDKLVSLFESHTAIIRRDKPRARVEYGHKVLLAETDGGILTQARVLAGNAADAGELDESLLVHAQQFGRPPHLVATDRGFWHPSGEERARAAGVTVVAIPQSGGRVSPARRAREREPWFRRAQRFRAGGEGRISVCKRRGHLGRCRDHGAEGFARWVGWGIIANNLRSIASADLTRVT